MALEVAKTIAAQIGTRAFAMMGAKNISGGESHLSWKLGGGAYGRATHMTVTLDASDTYTVEMLRCSVKTGRKVLAAESMVYADSLHEVIAEMTGFYLSL